MTTTQRGTQTDEQQHQPAQPSTAGPPIADRRVADLEAELAEVKADRTVEQERLDRRTSWRRFFSAALAIVAAFSIVFSLTGIWLRVTALDSERFATAAAPLTKNGDVARAISEYTAAEIVAHTGAQAEIERVLPSDATVLAGPIASALQDGLALGVQDVVQTDEFEAVFETAVRVAHEEALLILEGDGDVIESKNGLVTLNLLAVINDVLRAASSDLSAILGTTIDLPEINADDVPAAQIAELESALGVKLPADFGQVTLFESDELAEAQTWVQRFDTWLEVAIVVAIASAVGAFVLAFDRRRTVITMGIAVPVITVLTWLLVDANESSYASHIDDPTGRAAATAAADVMFAGLDRLAFWTVALSIVAVVAAIVTRNVSMDQVKAVAQSSGEDSDHD
ncbi:MAG: hypothetical protein ACR2QK_21585 [Acidimicrobiales bacterium]